MSLRKNSVSLDGYLMAEVTNHTTKVMHAARWSFLTEIASKAIGPVVMIVLARLLMPAEVGIVAAASIVISFSQVFGDMGLSKALIQNTDDELDKIAQIVFWSNIVLAIFVYAVLFLTADWIALLFKDLRVALVVKVQGVQLLLTALCSVQIAQYQKKLDYKPLFWIRILTVVIPGMASIPLALAGFGYWALVAGTLTGSLAQVVLLWAKVNWRPKLKYDYDLAGKLIKFGLWTSGEALAGWFLTWVDCLVVGSFLGAAELGIYRTGSAFVLLIFGLLLSPALTVMYSHFSKINSMGAEHVAKSMQNFIKLFTMVALPIGITLFAASDVIGNLVFGAKWLGIGTVIGLQGLTQAVGWTVAPNAEALRATGRPDLNTKIMFFNISYHLPIYLFAATQGLMFFLWARFACALITVLVRVWVMRIMVGIHIGKLLADMKWVVLGGGGMALTLYGCDRAFCQMHSIVGVAMALSAALVVYSSCLWPEKGFAIGVFNRFLNVKASRKSVIQ
jgi:PST family polysaccharide transporter